MKRFLALLLAVILACSMIPATYAAPEGDKSPEKIEDVWAAIAQIEDNACQARRAVSMEEKVIAYEGAVDLIADAVVRSADYVPGSLIRNGSFLFWDTVDGQGCGYSPRLRARIRETAIPDADPEAVSGIVTDSYAVRGGGPNSVDVAVFQPYYGIDSSFTTQYANEGKSIAQATGGNNTTYLTNNATIDNIANALETCAVVIFDSHGDTDYANGYDYTSRANTSYICLQSGTGITAADQVSVQGPYGSYKHAYYAGGYGTMQYYCVDGTAISNHMDGTAPNSLLWMAICLGMATSGLEAPLHSRGVEVVYGYSQSVTFTGDYAYEKYFWEKMKAGEMVKDAAAYMKQKVGIKDPYTSSYPAYPIFVSSEDNYPGHGNVDAAQSVYSTWTLFPQFTVTAVSNNPEWGSVGVSGRTITARPATGYRVAGYEVIEGTAAVTQDGNVFTVEPETDCTVQINFEPKVAAVVNFSVPDGVTCDSVQGYLHEEVVLPEPSGTPTANAHKYRFLGWTDAPITEDTKTMPVFYKVGARITVEQAETTLYALYSFFVADDGSVDGQYRLVTKAPSSWAGEYVITYQGEKALDASGTITGNNIGGSKAAIDLAKAGVTVEGDQLLDVPDSLVYEVAPADNGTYTFKMKDAEVYLALTSNSNALNTATGTGKTTAHWKVTWGANGPVITSAAFTRSLQYNLSAGLFRCYASSQQPLTLYAAAKGETWFTTVPKDKTDCDEHNFSDWTVTEEPTCTEPGSRVRVCTVCGYTENEEIEPLGHDYAEEVTPPTCTEGGYTTHTCTRCGDSFVDNAIDALGHAWDEGTVVTEPTETEPGVKRYTCTRCGAVRDEEIPAVPHDCPCKDFEDMPEFGTPEHEAIDWAYTHGITKGVTATQFGVGKTLTRAQAATFLYAAAGKPEFDAENAANPFSDVPAGAWFTNPVLWAASEGIVSGYSDGTFKPNGTLSRAQILVILYAQAGKPDVSGYENPYSDVPASGWFTNAALWAYYEGIERGEDGVFAQSTPCTREVFVLYLYRNMTGNCLLGDE